MLRKLTNSIEYVWAVFALVCVIKSVMWFSEGNADEGLFYAGFALVGVIMYFIRKTFRIRIQKSNEERNN